MTQILKGISKVGGRVEGTLTAKNVSVDGMGPMDVLLHTTVIVRCVRTKAT